MYITMRGGGPASFACCRFPPLPQFCCKFPPAPHFCCNLPPAPQKCCRIPPAILCGHLHTPFKTISLALSKIRLRYATIKFISFILNPHWMLKSCYKSLTSSHKFFCLKFLKIFPWRLKSAAIFHRISRSSDIRSHSMSQSLPQLRLLVAKKNVHPI